MRSVSIRQLDMKQATIPLGFEGENEFTEVRIDCKKTFDQHPNAVPSMTVTDPAGNKYPAVVTRDGDIVVWNITAGDLTTKGSGEIQIEFIIDGTVIGKTDIARTRIERSIFPEGEAPDPVQNWLDEANQTLAEVEEAKQAFPAGGTTGQVLTKKSDADYDTDWEDPQGGGGGTSNYNDLSNKPSINGVTLSGNKSLSDLSIPSQEDVNAKYTKPQGGIPASDIDPSAIPSPTSIIDDNAGEGDTNKVLSADKVTEITSGLREAIGRVTPEQFGAKGDGTTDDTEAVQAACNAGYEVRFGDNKTYLLTETVVIDHDVKIVGGKNTLFKNFQYANGESFFRVEGTKKSTTTLTTDYVTVGNTENSANRFTLNDMSEVEIGDILVITAEDQYYSYARPYYYLGGALLVTDIYDGHIYTSNSLPFNIENTENVNVEIYDAPEVTFENLSFMSNVDERRMYFRYAIDLKHCKNSTVRNCKINQMDMSIDVGECVNTHIDCVSMSKSKALNTIISDGYGIYIASSTNTIVERIVSLCSQACCCLSGTFPNINTYIRNCDLSAECRPSGIGLHENAYNTVIEDCTLGGAGLYGTVTMNRCRIIKNNRHGNDTNGIIFHGSHDERWAKIHIYDCELDGDKSDVGKCTTFSVKEPSPQNPVQNFACVVGEIIIRNCSGGTIKIDPEVGSGIESNTIKRFEIDHWDGCYEFYHTGECLIEYLGIKESRFVSRVWINKHSGDNFCYDNIRNLEFKSQYPAIDKQYASITKNGGSYVLPANVPITFTSSDTSGHYMVCGRNLASNNPTDFGIGTVGGSTGEAITFTPNSDFASSLSANASGNLVISSPNKTTQVGVYAKCMLYVDKPSMARISCKLKNTGSTNGQGFRCYIAIVDCSTGKLTYKGNGSLITATAQGAIATHERSVPEKSLVLCYLAMSGGGIANSQTTFEEYVIEVKDREFDSAVVYEAYNGSSRTGDGTLNSIEGKNNIMCSPASFRASFRVDKTDV